VKRGSVDDGRRILPLGSAICMGHCCGVDELLPCKVLVVTRARVCRARGRSSEPTRTPYGRVSFAMTWFDLVPPTVKEMAAADETRKGAGS
jgi:hypothetical protein